MSVSQPSLTNLESLMKAAESESSLMMDPNLNSNTNAQIIGSTTVTNSDDNELSALPKIPNIGAEVKEALNDTNIATMLNRISNNPEELNKVMEESMSQMTPDMMEQARKLAMGGQGKNILNEMQRRGMDPSAMRAQLLEQQRQLKGLSAKSGDLTKKVIFITSSRQVKVRNIPTSSIQASATSLIKSTNVVELSCSRLAEGPLKGKTIKVWCDPERPGKNKRATKIMGFPVSGEILIVMEEGDLLENDFLAAEKLLA
jgi:hypothetical protein